MTTKKKTSKIKKLTKSQNYTAGMLAGGGPLGLGQLFGLVNALTNDQFRTKVMPNIPLVGIFSKVANPIIDKTVKKKKTKKKTTRKKTTRKK